MSLKKEKSRQNPECAINAFLQGEEQNTHTHTHVNANTEKQNFRRLFSILFSCSGTKLSTK